MRTKKQPVSFIKQRQILLQQMLSRAPKGVVSMVIRFKNNDVPKFLRRLKRFEEQSRKARYVAR